MKEFITVLENSGQEIPYFVSDYVPIIRGQNGWSRRRSEGYTHYNRDHKHKSPLPSTAEKSAANLISQLKNADPKTLAAVKSILQKK